MLLGWGNKIARVMTFALLSLALLTRAVPADEVDKYWSEPVHLTNWEAQTDISTNKAGNSVLALHNLSHGPEGTLAYGIYISTKSLSANWSDPELLVENAGSPKVAIDENDTIHLFYCLIDKIFYTSRSLTGTWSTAEELFPVDRGRYSIVLDDSGTIHLAFFYNNALQYAYKPVAGNWIGPEVAADNLTESALIPGIAATKSGRIGIVWYESRSPDSVICYTHKDIGGDWITPAKISVDVSGNPVSYEKPSITADGGDNFHIVWSQFYPYYKLIPKEGDWPSCIEIPSEGYYGCHNPKILYDKSKSIIHITYEGSSASNTRLLHSFSIDGVRWTTKPIYDVYDTTDSQSSVATDDRGSLYYVWSKSMVPDTGIWFGKFSYKDSDNDGVSDEFEAKLNSDPYDIDSDDDGLADGFENFDLNDSVGSTETDPTDPDTDNDHIQDGTEIGITEPLPDPDMSGPLKGTAIALFVPDLDPVTHTDNLNADTDGDCLLDGEEDLNGNGRLDPGETSPINNVFGIDLGNITTFHVVGDAQTVVTDSVKYIDRDSFPVSTFYCQSAANGDWIGAEWLQTACGELRLWKLQYLDDEEKISLIFDQGLLTSWYPMKVGERKTTQAGARIPQYSRNNLNASMTVEVLSSENVVLDFGTVEAFKLRTHLYVHGYKYGMSTYETDWFVPNLGIVKNENDTLALYLSSFSRDSGKVNESVDADGDGVKDWLGYISKTDYPDSDPVDDSGVNSDSGGGGGGCFINMLMDFGHLRVMVNRKGVPNPGR